MYKSFHPKSSVDRIYNRREDGGRGLHGIENIVRAEEQSMKSYVQMKALTDPLMARCQELVNSWDDLEEKDGWYDKPLHGAWHQQVSQVADMGMGLSYQWLHKCDIRANTEALILAAQEQALNTRYIAKRIHHTNTDPRCRMCSQHDETISHLTSGCSKLAGTSYMERHNYVASIVYRAICSEYNIELPAEWKAEPHKVVENQHAKILWDFHIQTDRMVQHNQPDIVLIDKDAKTGLIIDIAVPMDGNIRDKELEKIDKYQQLKEELQTLWKVRMTVIPVVIGALGAVTERFPGWISLIPGKINAIRLQKAALLGTAKILRRVLKLPGLW
jgi:hypothetical protein